MCVCVHNGISVIKKNEITPSRATWMDLDIIMLRGISHKKTQIYHLHVELKKKKMIQMNLFKKRNRFIDTENKSMVTKGEWWDKFGI